jgi:MoxR-like ATPase
MNTRKQVLDLKQRVSASMPGLEGVVDRLFVALLTNGSVLMEGLQEPVMTRLVRTMAEHVGGVINHIRFTPDMMPPDGEDSEGARREAGTDDFRFPKRLLFGNFVLADGIEQIPARTQAALLEVMEQRQIMAASRNNQPADLFMLIATQDAAGRDGARPLPQEWMDSFLLHILIRPQDEEDGGEGVEPQRVLYPHEGVARAATVPQSVIFDARREVATAVGKSEAINLCFVDIISATRNPGRYNGKLARWIEEGAGARGTLSLDRAARAHAWLQGRDHVTVEDVRAIAADCLRHRIIPSHEAGEEGLTKDDLLTALLKHVAVP